MKIFNQSTGKYIEIEAHDTVVVRKGKLENPDLPFHPYTNPISESAEVMEVKIEPTASTGETIRRARAVNEEKKNE